ncbi:MULTISPECIES: ATP-binding protein [unclassified Gordonia (in: high G+C Gram-positive bacteria)]|uniref:AAA family ATPase n=1 Tax=unclassified Gordonia (in: high G+C Gram-positive bacteria) TaxID=2657482 RepID=UPI0010F8F89A|nr:MULTISPECIES: ATP-binding protein [unclassified Gordonia (in: high G+C Gram-positive bacteria)]UCZ88285.1 AAA family ATPase [Gordonia sp. WA4-43]
MRFARISASNWRNFKTLDFPIESRLFVVGPNAAGKSNLIDLIRFLGDIAGPSGGLTAALEKRGGLSKVRSLFARNNEGGRLVIEVDLTDGEDQWGYRLAIRGEKGGKNRPVVHEEFVTLNGRTLLQRPNRDDRDDPELLTQTHLEQIAANQRFRVLAEYFAKVRYFHLVPQIIREPSRYDMPGEFGGEFIAQMNAVTPKTRDAWLRRMRDALRAAVPEFESLDIEVDDAGKPHLMAGYRNWRRNPARQSEAEFSDGTLRLIGLLWTMVSTPANGGVLLLEEPELSLNASVVRKLPAMLSVSQRTKEIQVVLSTHAPELLDDEGVHPDEVLVLRPAREGTHAELLSQIEEATDDLAAELPTSDIVQGLIDPRDLSDLVTVGRDGKKR